MHALESIAYDIELIECATQLPDHLEFKVIAGGTDDTDVETQAILAKL